MKQLADVLVGRGTKAAVDVVDMPEDLGKLLDKGIEDHFRER